MTNNETRYELDDGAETADTGSLTELALMAVVFLAVFGSIEHLDALRDFFAALSSAATASLIVIAVTGGIAVDIIVRRLMRRWRG